ncbi:hypothetical protein A2870_03030 [Candidatus Curtissbacteria bacterium RIFCSPHIGHO2_01_FULL_41_11]|uniref:Ribulose-phosphate 3-epimerase n=1 Tax=Candidatus Curtissbacteria bacterium RIFCSPHIGHO2_01_FULL_41_11 TaxID=1797711 RepID=A0A1F5G6X6_9BACT|nr:MAG: hypothetical protein A2870_03030 [Candidatus Curtissbacteria bacterium RIFCSPHIGHO2_01_FULL_41_11]
MAVIVPGILTDSEEDYQKRLRLAEHVADLIQIDVVDGKFAKSKTVGVDVIKKVPSIKSLEIQLMVVKPSGYCDELGKLNFVSRIIFPFEIEGDIEEIIYTVKKSGKQIGLSLNPQTQITKAVDFFDDIDLLLLMTGRPGFSGQKLGEDTYERIHQAKMISEGLAVEIDIGVNETNVEKLARAGADFLVTSSAIYNARDFYVAFEKLAKLASMRR